MTPLARNIRFIRWELLILCALPLTRFVLEISGVPPKITEFISLWGFQLVLMVILPFRIVHHDFGKYGSLWTLTGLCCLVGFEVVALLVAINYLHPMHTIYAENSLHFGYSGFQHVLYHIFFSPIESTVATGLAATPIYFLARGIRAGRMPLQGRPAN
ncbi:MAG TPA: hypothetical protein VFC63_17750 [Blastocatellia bacterium]|nr:hypothetical protein [Blastocatellia bacterium]